MARAGSQWGKVNMACTYDDFRPRGGPMSDNYATQTQPSGWAMGWATFAAIMLMMGSVWGVIVAGLSAIVNFAWMPYYPVWAIVAIAVDIAIIWALTAHGRALAS